MPRLKGPSLSFNMPFVGSPRGPRSPGPSSPISSPRTPHRPASAPPSFGPRDQFTPHRPPSPPGSRPRSPTSPTSPGGPGSLPRSPSPGVGQRPWAPDSRIQQFSQNVAGRYEGTQLTQYVAQGSYPGGLNGGACNAITAEWIRQGSKHNSMNQASSAFGQKLDHSMDKLYSDQVAHEGRVQDMKLANQEIKTRLDALNAKQAQLEPLVEKYNKGELSPEEGAALAKEYRKLEKGYASVNRVKAEVDADIQAERERIGSGLPHKNLLDSAPINQDSIEKLHEATKKDGFYTIHISKPGGENHVMGLQSKNGQYKFMDPNTGEFTMNNHKASTNVLIDHLTDLYGSYGNISVEHFAG